MIEAGNGLQTLVMLHGIGSSARSWTHLLPLLAPHARCLAWDLPGYRGSDPLEPEFPVASDYLAILELWLAAEKIDSAVLLGHSLGALIAGEAAVQWPKRIAGVVFADPGSGHGLSPSDTWPEGLTRRIEDLKTLGQPAFAEARAPRMCGSGASDLAHQTTMSEMARVRLPGYAQAVALLAQAKLADNVPKIDCPLTFMVGDEDRITPPEGVKALADLHPDARYIELPGAGHAGYVEVPALYAEPIIEMLEQTK